MKKTKLATYLFEEDSEQNLDEFNAVGTGMVAGYQAPLGAPGVGSSSPLEKAFWRDKSGKEIKTASPALHKKKSRRKKIKETIKEAPYAEYDNLGFVDFKIELDKISKQEKEELISKFFQNEIAFLITHENKEYICDLHTAIPYHEDLHVKKPIHRAENFIHTMEESFGAMHEPDFSGEAMSGLWDSLKDIEDADQPVKTASPLLHANKKNTKINEAIIAGNTFWGWPNYNLELQNHGFWRHRKNNVIKTGSVALTKNKRNPKGHRHDLTEDDIHFAESMPVIKKEKDPETNVWTGFPDISNFEQKIKTSSPNLRRNIRKGKKR